MNTKAVELHLIQSFPPSCINRDGNNSPKDCTFGEARRARISSQCLKRAIRQADAFSEAVGEAIANRSKQMRDRKLIPHLLAQGLTLADAEAAADAFRRDIAKDDKKIAKQTSVGLYFGDEELLSLLDAHRSGDKSWATRGARKSADVALFGRMLAEARDLNVDAAAQVAHAISTHRLSQEMDYWTAADDLKASEDDDAGASMLGSSEFNASVFYRYACVSVPILSANLGDESELVPRTIEGFLAASFDAIPTGKINGHAHFTAPMVALAVVRRRGMPLNLCNAFLRPVRATAQEDLGQGSARQLFTHLQNQRKLARVDDALYVAAGLDGYVNAELAGAGVEIAAGYGALIERVVSAL